MNPNGAQMYGLTALRREMAQVGSNLDRPVDAYLIGGCAMSFSGLKTATKDIDMILSTASDLQVLTSVLESLFNVTLAGSRPNAATWTPP